MINILTANNIMSDNFYKRVFMVIVVSNSVGHRNELFFRRSSSYYRVCQPHLTRKKLYNYLISFKFFKDSLPSSLGKEVAEYNSIITIATKKGNII